MSTGAQYVRPDPSVHIGDDVIVDSNGEGSLTIDRHTGLERDAIRATMQCRLQSSARRLF